MANYKKHIIWSNDNLSVKDWKDYFEENDIKEEDEYAAMYEMNDLYLGDERINLSSIKGRVLCIATLGLWNGKRQGSKIYGCLSDVLDSECDYVEWYVTPLGMFCTASHHDGTNYYEYRLIREGVDIDKICDCIYNGETIPRRTLREYTTNLWKPIQDVYGF